VPHLQGVRGRRRRDLEGLAAGRDRAAGLPPRRVPRPRVDHELLVQDSSPGSFQAFHDLLYANQPAEGSAGLPDSTLADLAAQTGANRATIASDLASQRFRGWTVQATDAFSQRYTGTPTVLVDGQQQQSLDPAALKAAVAAAAAAKGLPAPK
jgi:hypothetical protein